MRIALFSDVHANLPAFEEVLESIEQQNPDTIYCLGDLVGYNVWPNQIIREVRKRRISTIAGNHDAKVGKLSAAQLNEQGKNYGYKIIDQEGKDYLAALPAHIRIEYKLNGKPLNILLVHGSPASNDEYLLQDKPEADFLEVFRKVDADILCFGHSHKPFYRVIEDNTGQSVFFRHAINIGSVGKPKDGNPQGCYVILTISDNGSALQKDSIQVEFIRFDYEIEKAAKAVEESPLPNELADMLRKAY